MPDATPGLTVGRARPGTEFVGRQAELSVLGTVADLLLRGIPSPLTVIGQPGVGRTEFLLQAAARLHDPRRGLAVVHVSLAGPAEAAARSLVLAVRGIDPTGAVDPSREPGPVGALFRRGAAGDGAAFVDSAARAAAAETGMRLLVLLDHVPRGAAVPSSSGEVVWVTTPERGDGSGSDRRLRLEPLNDDRAEELLALACARAGVRLSPEARPAAVVLGGLPALLWGAAAAARLAGVTAFDSDRAFLDFWASQQEEGFVGDYHRALLGGHGGDGARLELDVLVHLGGRRGLPPDAEELAREMLREPGELGAALSSLEARGLVGRRWGLVVPAGPPTLAGWCRDQAARWLEGCSSGEASARLVLGATERLRRAAESGAAVRNGAEMAAFLRGWDGQKLPRSLFDRERFEEVSSGKELTAEELSAADRGRITLPRVVGAWREDFPGNDRFPSYGLDLLAAAMPAREGACRWLAADLRLEAAEVTAGMVRDFDRRLRLFQNRSGARSPEVTGWVVSGGGFSAEALAALRELRFWSSGPAQLRIMAALAGSAGPLRLVLPGSAPAAPEPLEFRMDIPDGGETELVAARAMEQIGERLPFDEVEVGRIKMALVEACLNAFEHGRSEDRRVRLTFRVHPDRLEIEVHNRGLAFVPGPIAVPDIREKVGGGARKRGWGLSIIKELMDELEFERPEEGTLLRMTKHFPTRTGEGRHA